MISVVIPLYNKASTIRRCLKSVFSQTIAPNELLIINDGSQDDSLDIVKETIDFNSEISIKVVDQENSGVSYTRNKGVSLAKNDFVAFLDADDEWHSTFIEHAALEISSHNDISLYTCKHEIWDESIGRFTPNQTFGNNESGLIDNYLARARSCEIVNSSKVVINKRYFEKVGGFPVQAKVAEDMFLWIKLSECAPIAYCDKLLVTVHQAPDNSRDSRIGEIPYPITYYSSKHQGEKLHSDLYSLLWSIHFKHVLGSCATNKREALNRILYGTKLFKQKGALLLPLLVIPKYIFNYIRIRRRNKMVKSSA